LAIFKNIKDSAHIDAFLVKLGVDRSRSMALALEKVSGILERILKGGDKALAQLAKEIDNVYISPESFFLSKDEIDSQSEKLPSAEKKALEESTKHLECFFGKEKYLTNRVKIEEGGFLELEFQPIERVGLYVPGGKGLYPSSVLMLGVPALLAGVQEKVLVTPVLDREFSPALAYACKIAGINEVLRVGGPHGLAAIGVGTKRIKKVDKIFGPGNQFVTAMKKLLFGYVGIDMLAGPSEIVIITDESSDPSFVWLDALAQLEHGSNEELAIVISLSENFMVIFNEEKGRLIAENPRISNKIKMYENKVIFLNVLTLELAIQLANKIAPEHLSIQIKDSFSLKEKIKNAGAIFLGPYTPVALGDYSLGTNHVLPTSGSAKFWSCLSIIDFLKRRSTAYITKDAYEMYAEPAKLLCSLEGFEIHGLSIQERLK